MEKDKNRIGDIIEMDAFTPADFEFVICAYKKSQYLEECICSLQNQSTKVKIVLVTSTPNEYIKSLVSKYQLEYYINTGENGIAGDWNFALSVADKRAVAIAHQDDVYEPNYVQKMLDNINRQDNVLIAFANYGELRNGEQVTGNKLLNTKRFMLLPLKNKKLQNVRFVRRRILSFGSAICCPSVTYIKENLPQPIFHSGYRSNVDWQAWEMLSRRKGAFVYCDSILMYHRIHKESATTAIIADNDRTKEDYEMFCKFWPRWAAKMIEHFYKKCEESNTLKNR